VRAGLLAGIANTVYTLWPLQDAPQTVAIIERFYRELLTSRRSCPAALRAALLPSMALHPWLWGGFQVAGRS
jgi:CHAT domain-containing protein